MSSMNPRSRSSPMSRIAVPASAFVLSLLLPGAGAAAQTAPPFEGPACVAPPTPPDGDTWPRAGTVALPDTTSPLAVAFTGAMLLQNDHGTTPLRLVSVASRSSNGGSVSGNDPFVYVPAALFTGTDIFTYVISDDAGERTTGVVTVTVNPDVAAPAVSISSPADGASASGIVTITSAATDNVRVSGVTFFDGATPIGAEDLAAPFTASWDSRQVADGPHRLTAVARDAAGNIATSAAIVVNVVNSAPR
jgi:hypothetical protein